MIKVFYHDETDCRSNAPEQASGFEKTCGNGEVHCYKLFDGAMAMLMRLELEKYTEFRTKNNILEINFCINGRFETQFSLRDNVLLKSGDMAVSSYDGIHGSQSESFFPLGYYEGICLEIDPIVAENWIKNNMQALSLDINKLKNDLIGNRWYMCGSAGPHCEHVFREIYEMISYADISFLRLKVIELLMLLNGLHFKTDVTYFSSQQARLASHIRDCLLTDNDKYVSLDQLADEYGISVSYLQKLFKKAYGMPVYRYIKEYRLERAATEMIKSDLPIITIAQNAGYDNAGKFSESFKKRYGLTPSEYRLANGRETKWIK